MATGTTNSLGTLNDLLKPDYELKHKDNKSSYTSKDANGDFMKVFEAASKSYNQDVEKSEFRRSENNGAQEQYSYDQTEYRTEPQTEYKNCAQNDNYNNYENKEPSINNQEKEYNPPEHNVEAKESGDKNISGSPKVENSEQTTIKEQKAETENKKTEPEQKTKETANNDSDNKLENKEPAKAATAAEAPAATEAGKAIALEAIDKPLPIAAQTTLIKDMIKPLEAVQKETGKEIVKTQTTKGEQGKPEQQLKAEQLKDEQNKPEQANIKSDTTKGDAAKTELNNAETTENNKVKEHPSNKLVGQKAPADKPEVEKELDGKAKSTVKDNNLVVNTADNKLKETADATSNIPAPKKLDIKEELKVESVKVSVETQKDKKDAQSNLMDMNKNNQQGLQQEGKANLSASQSVQTTLQAELSEGSAQKVDTQKTGQFDKVMDAKQAESTEKAVLNQVKNAASQLNNEKTQVTIALRPENLGRVSIQIASQNGEVTAQITAESQQAKDSLSKGVDALKQALAEQGITVNKIVVNQQESSSDHKNDPNHANLGDNSFSEAGSKSHEQDNLTEKDSGHYGIGLAEGTTELSEEEETEQNKETISAGSTVEYRV